MYMIEIFCLYVNYLQECSKEYYFGRSPNNGKLLVLDIFLICLISNGYMYICIFAKFETITDLYYSLSIQTFVTFRDSDVYCEHVSF